MYKVSIIQKYQGKDVFVYFAQASDVISDASVTKGKRYSDRGGNDVPNVKL